MILVLFRFGSCGLASEPGKISGYGHLQKFLRRNEGTHERSRAAPYKPKLD
jgi:hypothetical protein